jgi:hypothetical protein
MYPAHVGEPPLLACIEFAHVSLFALGDFIDFNRCVVWEVPFDCSAIVSFLLQNSTRSEKKDFSFLRAGTNWANRAGSVKDASVARRSKRSAGSALCAGLTPSKRTRPSRFELNCLGDRQRARRRSPTIRTESGLHADTKSLTDLVLLCRPLFCGSLDGV